MIHYNVDKFPLVYLTFSESNWDKEEYTAIMGELHGLIAEAAEQNVRVKLLVRAGVVDSPPLRFFAWLGQDLLKMKQELEAGIHKTAVWKERGCPVKKYWSVISRVYTPARPVEFFEDSAEALTWLEAPLAAGPPCSGS
jgi:hypothetical protein